MRLPASVVEASPVELPPAGIPASKVKDQTLKLSDNSCALLKNAGDGYAVLMETSYLTDEIAASAETGETYSATLSGLMMFENSAIGMLRAWFDTSKFCKLMEGDNHAEVCRLVKELDDLDITFEEALGEVGGTDYEGALAARKEINAIIS